MQAAAGLQTRAPCHPDQGERLRKPLPGYKPGLRVLPIRESGFASRCRVANPVSVSSRAGRAALQAAAGLQTRSPCHPEAAKTPRDLTHSHIVNTSRSRSPRPTIGSFTHTRTKAVASNVRSLTVFAVRDDALCAPDRFVKCPTSRAGECCEADDGVAMTLPRAVRVAAPAPMCYFLL